jgi:demethylmenaquinone methyltransferase / 2-methoxy-6-polyprenyl-1,4-benzoquinol methylase
MKGATPAGAHDEHEAAAWVRNMFGRVARRYDLLNHLLSFNTDHYWRARTVRALAEPLNRPGARVLDLCCGTGDLLLALERRTSGLVFGADFCHPMMLEARGKIDRSGSNGLLFEADGLALPLASGTVDVIAVAFGFRNFANYRRGLGEMRRVLRAGGTVAILEFSQPPNAVFAALYRFYSRRVLPRLGGWISGHPDAYTYLPDSVRRFPSASELAEEMRRAGFRQVRFVRMTAGIVALHLGSA